MNKQEREALYCLEKAASQERIKGQLDVIRGLASPLRGSISRPWWARLFRTRQFTEVSPDLSKALTRYDAWMCAVQIRRQERLAEMIHEGGDE